MTEILKRKTDHIELVLKQRLDAAESAIGRCIYKNRSFTCKTRDQLS